MRWLLRTRNDVAVLLLRLALGVVFVAHGGQKVGLFGGTELDETVANFAKMGIPEWQAYLVVAGELLGGAALVLGFLTRIAALGPLAVMAGAIYYVHWQHGLFMPQGFECQMVYGVVALALVIRGGGALSIDRALSGPTHSDLAAGGLPPPPSRYGRRPGPTP